MAKKDKLARYDALERERDLLERYFWDSRDRSFAPDVRVSTTTKDVAMRFSLYQTERGHGGYVVVEQFEFVGRKDTGVPEIHYWDDYTRFADALGWDDSGSYSYAVKLAVEHLRHDLAKFREERQALAVE